MTIISVLTIFLADTSIANAGSWNATVISTSETNDTHAFHHVVRMPRGWLVLCGGDDAVGTHACESFDPDAEAWTRLSHGMSKPGSTLTRLADGEMLMTGGYYSPTTSSQTWIYNLYTDTKTFVADFDEGRAYHHVWWYNNTFMTVGGWVSPGNTTLEEQYNIDTGMWEATEDGLQNGWNRDYEVWGRPGTHYSGIDDSFWGSDPVVIGGVITESASSPTIAQTSNNIWIKLAGEWRTVYPEFVMQDRRGYSATAACKVNNFLAGSPSRSVGELTLIITGGWSYKSYSADAEDRYNDTVDRFKPGSCVISAGYADCDVTPGAIMPVEVAMHAAATSQNGNGIIVVGGKSATDVLDTIYYYDCGTDTWTDVGAINTARYGHKVTLLKDGTHIVTGGYDQDGNALTTAERFEFVYTP